MRWQSQSGKCGQPGWIRDKTGLPESRESKRLSLENLSPEAHGRAAGKGRGCLSAPVLAPSPVAHLHQLACRMEGVTVSGWEMQKEGRWETTKGESGGDAGWPEQQVPFVEEEGT